MRYSCCLLALVAVPAALTAAPRDPAALAAVIDARLAAEWKKAGVAPAPAVDDATFLRRASLDLLGRVPAAAEVRAFLADAAPDKRAKLVARLTAAGGHTRHMATFWRRTWVPQADTPEFARLADDFEAWVGARLQEGAPYDRVVRELLTLPEARTARGPVSPVGFFAASESKPENLAASATRAFLGVNLDCAQCHDHPFARWTRDQFWQTAAFFAPPTTDKAGKSVPPELTIPNTKRALSPELLDGSAVKWPAALAADTGRALLAGWLTAKDNPYFARNAVNRLWAHLYGTALVEPLDDLSGDGGNTGYHADLLKELATAFADGGFDLKYLTRALVLTKAYQLSAVVAEDQPSDPRLFARMPVRGLTGEQLYDSLRTAAGLPTERADTDRGLGLEARKRFAARFHVERPVTAERSVTQALAMMNGRLTNDLADPAKNPTLGGVVGAPFLDTKGKVETLFLAALGRAPTAKELRTMTDHIEGAFEADRDRALGDVFWALVNSTEFNTNH
ncbi:DUF1549 and DUF1553 domain-containing protein [Gemmata sp. JC717]|uniref:DUF1549 and DUF1553 domain-containing protein n=1 Tax=Gemmata algarum TaxID=2975278 RepID=UPI0021BB7BE3|nr:DUF1549 and DUF1553 domain-containing protein [Gemmata algarum]MDY3552764.1 DUF1549 and DUF1553 domain-containing protein [Gemmata algarum]